MQAKLAASGAALTLSPAGRLVSCHGGCAPISLRCLHAGHRALTRQGAVHSADRPPDPALQATAAHALPGTPAADLASEVQSCLEMMRACRVQLADRLAHSAGVCQAVAADCEESHCCGTQVRAEGEQDPEAFGSPAAGSSSTCGPSPEEEPAVLGISRRIHANLPQPSPSPTKKAAHGKHGRGALDEERQAARARVAEVRAQHSGWDLAGFMRSLGHEVSCCQLRAGQPIAGSCGPACANLRD
jgi:hypothetical protein